MRIDNEYFTHAYFHVIQILSKGVNWLYAAWSFHLNKTIPYYLEAFHWFQDQWLQTRKFQWIFKKILVTQVINCFFKWISRFLIKFNTILIKLILNKKIFNLMNISNLRWKNCFHMFVNILFCSVHQLDFHCNIF